jgi:tRNA-binding EMAP/Myf-like protein
VQRAYLSSNQLELQPHQEFATASGVVVGLVKAVRTHNNADRIRLADIALSDDGRTVQIVFGGPDIVREGHLVPVAPPGSWVPVKGKMRRRNYRGESSYGMLCSLDELGWTKSGPDEVAVLHSVCVGDSLDDRLDWMSIVASPKIHPSWVVSVLEPGRYQSRSGSSSPFKSPSRRSPLAGSPELLELPEEPLCVHSLRQPQSRPEIGVEGQVRGLLNAFASDPIITRPHVAAGVRVAGAWSSGTG